MINGYLHFDASEKPLAQKVERAVKNYEAVHGSGPDRLWLHPYYRVEVILNPMPEIEFCYATTMIRNYFYLVQLEKK